MIAGGAESSRPEKESVTSLDKALARLRDVTVWLQIFGYAIVIAVLVQIVFVWVTLRVVLEQPAGVHHQQLGYGFVALGGALLFAVFFDRMRRVGDDLFNEISDQLQSKDELAPLELRLRMRAFVRSSELPLVPARTGLVLYLVIAVCLLFFQTWLVFKPNS